LSGVTELVIDDPALIQNVAGGDVNNYYTDTPDSEEPLFLRVATVGSVTVRLRYDLLPDSVTFLARYDVPGPDPLVVTIEQGGEVEIIPNRRLFVSVTGTNLITVGGIPTLVPSNYTIGISTTPPPTASPSPTVVPTTPGPTATPSFTPSATPTVSQTATPTSDSTPTPSATVSPTDSPTQSQSPTPTPDPAFFSFESNASGWTFASAPPPFEETFGRFNDVNDALDIVTNGNTSSFGFWERDGITVGTATEGSTASVLYRATWRAFSDQANASLAPVVRLRASSINFQQSDIVVATSTGDGGFSPGTGGRTYTQYFAQPATRDTFRLSFDVLNFDPSDAAFARMSLSSARIDWIGDADRSGGQRVTNFTFGGGNSGWSSLPMNPVIAKPLVFSTVNGLRIQGLALPPTSSRPAPPEIFGYWGIDTTVPFEANTLYRVRWRVGSTADAGATLALPAMRMRVNDSSFKFSALVNIESVGEAALLPSTNAPREYDLWLATPPEIAGNNWIFSFDYLWVNKPLQADQDDPTLAVILQSLDVTKFALP